MIEANQKQINSDYKWLMTQNLSQFAGQWLAVSHKKIIARDDKLKKVMKVVSTMSIQEIPLYLRVPTGSMVI